jgi:VWFA-related protein
VKLAGSRVRHKGMRYELGLVAYILSLFLPVLGLARENADHTPTFTAGTSLVRIDFEVLHKLAPVGPFTANDLIVKDKGQMQPIRAVSEGELPLDLVLLFDVSGSMDTLVERVAASAELAFQQLQPDDRIAVMTFNDNTRLLLRLTTDLDRALCTVRERVVHGDFDGGTSLLAGVDDAAKYLLTVPRGHRRRAIIVVTDNLGVRSRKESTVVNRLWEADATVHAIIFSTRAQTVAKWYTRVAAPHLELMLREGVNGAVSKTGGVILSDREAGSALPELIRRIRARPVLYYTMPPGPAGQFRRVQVELAGDMRRQFPKARVYARRGYHVPTTNRPEPVRPLRGILIDEEPEEAEDDDEYDEPDLAWLSELELEEHEAEEGVLKRLQPF